MIHFGRYLYFAKDLSRQRCLHKIIDAFSMHYISFIYADLLAARTFYLSKIADRFIISTSFTKKCYCSKLLLIHTIACTLINNSQVKLFTFKHF